MKISALSENVTPSSTPNGNNPSSAPTFGRDPKVLETTVAGNVSGGEPTNMGMQSRSKKGSNLLRGIKTSKKYANSEKAGIREEAIIEDDISEEQLLDKQVRQELFNKAKARDIGNKPKDRDIMAKEEFNGGGEYNDEVDMVQNNLHTIVRVSTHLGKELQANENMPEWVQEKIAVAKSMIVTVMDYMISQHERGNVYTVDMDEGQLEYNTPDPVVVIQDLKGNILDKMNLSTATQKYKLGQPQNIKNQLAHQNYTRIGNYTIVSPMTGQPQDKTTQGVAEGSLEEIDRRGFLKGLGAAAIAGAAGGVNAQTPAELEIEFAYRMALAKKQGKSGKPFNVPKFNPNGSPADLQIEHAYKLARAEAGFPPAKSSTKESVQQGVAEGSKYKYKCTCHPGDADPDCPVHGLEPMEVGDALDVKEGAKVDRMVKHIKSSEKKIGHSDKEAENIAWATANKRGMLDNKNKKVKEAGYGRNRGYSHGFASPTAPSLGGRRHREDDEGWDREEREKNQMWYIRIDGKILKKQGVPYTFYGIAAARKAAQTMMAKDFNKGKKFVVTTKPEDMPNQDIAEEQLDELKCWSGYHRVAGTKAGFPGSCAKNKTNEESVAEEKCPECGGPMFSEMIMNEKKDACYYKVKSRYKVWPSAYASGALVKCRNKGASNWGTGGKKNESIDESLDELDENLHQWFKEKWVRFGPDGKIRGSCARGDDSEGKPKCLPQSKAHSLGKKGRASAAARKRREDPNPERSGKAINVNTKKKS